jgi:hypothetical protein
MEDESNINAGLLLPRQACYGYIRQAVWQHE